MEAVARYTLLEISRRRLLLALMLVAVGLIVALGVAPFILPGFNTPSLRADFLLGGLDRLVGIFLLISGFAIGVTVIYNDLDSGAAVAILAKPVSRLAYTAAKTGAALTSQILVAAVLAAFTSAVLLLNGGGYDYGAVVTSFLAWTANVLALVLIVMALTTMLNNIVAAVVGFVIYEIFGAVTTLHDFVVHNVPIASPWKEIINIAYTLVPHQLVGGLPREVIRVELNAGLFAKAFADHPSFDPYRGVPDPSSAGDIVSLAAYCVVIALLLYLAVRRRQV